MMRTGKRIIAVLIAVILLIPAIISTGAITVTHDGKAYTLRSRTPTTGDLKVLAVRVGFADYPVDDEDYPADSEETLRSYFDGSPNSVNGFYQTSSYGKLRISCDQVYTYNAQKDRAAYENEDYETRSGLSDLMNEALTALHDELDLDSFDSDGDGYLDLVCFDFAGPLGDYASVWWPHVSKANDLTIGNKRISAYTFLKSDERGVAVFIHEFGHLFGAADYYSTMDRGTNSIMTFDMMSGNEGDHNGFTKWSYGWFDDKDIAFVDKAAGDTVVTLSPIETDPDGGKKIAVVAPAIDKEKGFADEYFLVEYDAGLGNNAAIFAQQNYEPGFRIFHVIAGCQYDDSADTIDYEKDNTVARSCLIHSLKDEDDAPASLLMGDMFYREGDALTPYGYPNTGLSAADEEELYHGRYTGISFTDFVTGDHPSFKVSFSDEEVLQPQPQVNLSYQDLRADMKMTLSSDTPLIRTLSSDEATRPYLLDKDGNKLYVEVNSAQGTLYRYSIRYPVTYPAVLPNTDYTLVLPEGMFKYGYDQVLPEFRQNLRSSDFFAAQPIQFASRSDKGALRTAVFPVTDSTYGIIELPLNGARGSFIEYNLVGEEIARYTFDTPDDSLFNYGIYQIEASKLFDGNFALRMYASDRLFLVKLDGKGKMLGEIQTITANAMKGYAEYLTDINFECYKDGLCANLYSRTDRRYLFLTVDFTQEPQYTNPTGYYRYYPVDRDAYIICQFEDDDAILSVYNSKDALIGKIRRKMQIFGVAEDHGNIVILNYTYGDGQGDVHTNADTYSRTGELLDSRDIESAAAHIRGLESVNRTVATDAGFYLTVSVPTLKEKEIVAFDRSWNYVGTLDVDYYLNPAYVGVCGLLEKTEFVQGRGIVEVVQRFALGDFEITPVRELLRGDANLDGTVDILDVTTIQRYDISLIRLSETALRLADVDQDGEVTILDATWISRHLVGMSSPL